MVVVKPGLPIRNQKLFSGETLDCAGARTHVNNVCPGTGTDGCCSDLLSFYDTGDEWHLVLGPLFLLKTHYCWKSQNSKSKKNPEHFHTLDCLLQVLSPTFTH